MDGESVVKEPRIIPSNLVKKELLVSFRLDAELKDKIIAYATRRNLSRSKAIREILVLFLEKGVNYE